MIQMTGASTHNSYICYSVFTLSPLSLALLYQCMIQMTGARTHNSYICYSVFTLSPLSLAL